MPATETLSTLSNTTAVGDGGTPNDMCGACSHPMSDHDVISARFCAATIGGSLTRGCVCAQR
jgi:hypothetical protein